MSQAVIEINQSQWCVSTPNTYSYCYTDGQIDRQTQTDRQTDRQTERERESGGQKGRHLSLIHI